MSVKSLSFAEDEVKLDVMFSLTTQVSDDDTPKSMCTPINFS